jgi:hypothetical protein
LPGEEFVFVRETGPGVSASRKREQPAVENILAPELARNALAFKPTRVDHQAFREVPLKPV